MNAEVSRPRLAAGCRWGMHGDEPVVLYPEGMIRAEGTGRKILELCDGHNSLQQIVTKLTQLYENADPEKVSHDVMIFVETLHRKRIVDY
jgi:coenzyme PQQ biosynthesis protein PqqD